MDWEECCGKRIVKDVKPDIELVASLKKSSGNKMESARQLLLSEVTAASKLSLAYDSLRELLEALALVNGYKVYNHECYGAFLAEVLHESSKGDSFDEIRKIRNTVNYYGAELSVEEAENIIMKIKALRKSVGILLGSDNIP
jgi:uncharacterized protein (UPF0332 family)